MIGKFQCPCGKQYEWIEDAEGCECSMKKETPKYDFHLKPSCLRGWHIVGETEKSLIIRKRWAVKDGHKNYIGDSIYLAKKNIVKRIEVK